MPASPALGSRVGPNGKRHHQHAEVQPYIRGHARIPKPTLTVSKRAASRTVRHAGSEAPASSPTGRQAGDSRFGLRLI